MKPHYLYPFDYTALATFFAWSTKVIYLSLLVEDID